MNAITQLKKEFDALQEKINVLKLDMQQKSKVLIKEALSEFLNKYDGVVHSIFWKQYTPYFNDGGSCVFSVHGVYIMLESDVGAENQYLEEDGSMLYEQDDIRELKSRIVKWESFRKNSREAALEYRAEYIKKYKRDPFDMKHVWGWKSTEQSMAEWTPDYVSEEQLRKKLLEAENIVANHPSLKDDFMEIDKLILGIDEDVMQGMFGDHVKVIVTKEGIEIEEYDHD